MKDCVDIKTRMIHKINRNGKIALKMLVYQHDAFSHVLPILSSCFQRQKLIVDETVKNKKWIKWDPPEETSRVAE